MKKLLVILLLAAGARGDWTHIIPIKTIKPIHDSAFRFIAVADPAISVSYGIDNTYFKSACLSFRNYNANAFFMLGDIGDGTYRHLMQGVLSSRVSLIPTYITLGNHDIQFNFLTNTANVDTIGMQIGYGPPFYYSTIVYNGDSSKSIRLFILDINFNSDSTKFPLCGYIGQYAGETPGGGGRMLCPTQLAWVSSTLASDATTDAIAYIMHYPPGTSTTPDDKKLGTIFKNDGRDAIGFSGHAHIGGATYKLYSEDSTKMYVNYKPPTMNTSASWTRFEFHLDLDNKWVIDSAVINNWINPDGYTNDETVYEVK
jgi:hypothetical protein